MEKKIRLDELKKGMYVSALEKTGQGVPMTFMNNILINSEEDIERFRRAGFCTAYIDVEEHAPAQAGGERPLQQDGATQETRESFEAGPASGIDTSFAEDADLTGNSPESEDTGSVSFLTDETDEEALCYGDVASELLCGNGIEDLGGDDVQDDKAELSSGWEVDGGATDGAFELSGYEDSVGPVSLDEPADGSLAHGSAKDAPVVEDAQELASIDDAETEKPSVHTFVAAGSEEAGQAEGVEDIFAPGGFDDPVVAEAFDAPPLLVDPREVFQCDDVVEDDWSTDVEPPGTWSSGEGAPAGVAGQEATDIIELEEAVSEEYTSCEETEPEAARVFEASGEVTEECTGLGGGAVTAAIGADSTDEADSGPDAGEERAADGVGPGAAPASHSGAQAAATEEKKSDFMQDLSDFTEELHEAKRIRKDAEHLVKDFMNSARLGMGIEPEKVHDTVDRMVDSICRNQDALASLSRLRSFDDYTFTHSVNVCTLALTVGRHMGLDKSSLHDLGVGAILHDVGKMLVPVSILNKQGSLSAAEFMVMKNHPVLGAELLSRTDGIKESSVAVARQHHERQNGSGYPGSVKGEEQHIYARITAVADVYDAMTSNRVYQKGMKADEALKKMYLWRNDHFEATVVERLIKCLGVYPIGTAVELNTGEVAVVRLPNHSQPLKPVVQMLLDKNKNPYHEPFEADLKDDKGRWIVSSKDPDDYTTLINGLASGY